MLLELFDVYRSLAADRGIELILRDEETLPIIEADAERLRQVFTNLLDNALKYSTEGGRVTVEMQETDEDVRVRVTDQGPGIDPDDLPYIFDPYHRGKDSGRKGGYGVGLAAVKAIVEGHGGKVLVESEMGKGSAFTVVLPGNGRGKGLNGKRRL